jgi:hypothetical protein
VLHPAAPAWRHDIAKPGGEPIRGPRAGRCFPTASRSVLGKRKPRANARHIGISLR